MVAKRMVTWIGISSSKYHDWQERYGKVNEHNAWVPRDHWLDEEEKRAIVEFQRQYPLEGYRRLAFMMLDRDLVAVSPSSVYRVLRGAGSLRRWNHKPSKKGTGFVQPLRPHEHWHVDISYINVCGTFYYLCTLLDGCSRYVVRGCPSELPKRTDQQGPLSNRLPEAPATHRPPMGQPQSGEVSLGRGLLPNETRGRSKPCLRAALLGATSRISNDVSS